MKFTAEQPSKLINLLVQNIKKTSKTKVKKLIKEGIVYIDGELVTETNAIVKVGQIVEIIRNKKHASKEAKPVHKTLRYRILKEDEQILVIEKPAGVPTISNDKDSIYNAISQYLDPSKEFSFIYKLGRQTSGILIFAKTATAKAYLLNQQLEKRYCALVEGHPNVAQGTIKNYLRVSEGGKTYLSTQTGGGVLAVSHYKTLKTYPKHTLLEIEKETDVKGQIRVLLSEMDCPIVGDKKYGATKNPFGRLALHLFSVLFKHPTSGKVIRLSSPTPHEFITYGRGRS